MEIPVTKFIDKLDFQNIDKQFINQFVLNFLAQPVPLDIIKTNGHTVYLGLAVGSTLIKISSAKKEAIGDFQFDDQGREWVFVDTTDLLVRLQH